MPATRTTPTLVSRSGAPAERTLDRLGEIAADAAMRGAAEWVRRHPDAPLNTEALTLALRAHARDALDDALAHAREALNAGMGAVAELSFLASMRLAGIAAARETAELAALTPTGAR